MEHANIVDSAAKIYSRIFHRHGVDFRRGCMVQNEIFRGGEVRRVRFRWIGKYQQTMLVSVVSDFNRTLPRLRHGKADHIPIDDWLQTIPLREYFCQAIEGKCVWGENADMNGRTLRKGKVYPADVPPLKNAKRMLINRSHVHISGLIHWTTDR